MVHDVKQKTTHLSFDQVYVNKRANCIEKFQEWKKTKKMLVNTQKRSTNKRRMLMK